MSTIITGGTGFVGRHLARKLKENANIFGKIINVSRSGVQASCFDASYKVDLGTQENSTFGMLKFVLDKHKPDYIFHLASKATVKMDGLDAFNILNDNILSTQKICEWSPKGCKVVLASTVIVYGDWIFADDSKDEYDETDRTEPTSIYGMTKRASESILRYHTSTGKIQGVSARMCATVGSGLTHGVVYDFIRKIKENPILEAIGSYPGSTKPYMHVDDLTTALTLLALKQGITGEYNLVPDDKINIEQVGKAVMEGLGTEKEIKWLGEAANWSGDNRLISVSNQKLKSIGWKPKYSSSEAIVKAVKEMTC
tara:strand:+ start:5014 stop:5949 length:936 start_codon:yes stop_codon:yes gene_type:complete